MDGRELARLLRHRLGPGVLIYSHSAWTPGVTEGLEPFDGHLPKPFRPAELDSLLGDSSP